MADSVDVIRRRLVARFSYSTSLHDGSQLTYLAELEQRIQLLEEAQRQQAPVGPIDKKVG